MLLKVTKEQIIVDFRSYGKILIPKGIRTTHQTASGIDEKINFIDEFEWIDGMYPDYANILKEDIGIYGINIPDNKLMFAIRVKFAYDDHGNCKDVFFVNNKTKICRIQQNEEFVSWYTLTEDWEEPLCPLRVGMLIQIQDIDNKIVVSEEQINWNESYVASKRFPFSWEDKQEEYRLFQNIYLCP